MKLIRLLLMATMVVLLVSSCDPDNLEATDTQVIEIPSTSIEVSPLPEEIIVPSEEPESEPEFKNLTISDTLIIGDSNTVRMSMYGTSIISAKHISAIVGVGACNWSTYKNASNTTDNKTIYDDLSSLDDAYFDQVLILLGTNDFYQESDKFKNSYLTLIDYLRLRNPEVVIFLGTTPPVRDPASSTIKNSDASRISGCIRDISQQENLQLIDINDYLSPEDMSSSKGDGYHLSKDGASKLADYLVERLGVDMAL